MKLQFGATVITQRVANRRKTGREKRKFFFFGETSRVSTQPRGYDGRLGEEEKSLLHLEVHLPTRRPRYFGCMAWIPS